MTRSRYDLEEALNRILRTLEGKALTADTPEVITGDVLNKEDAMSDISELLDNSLPGETLSLPTAVVNALPAATTAVAGIAQLADVNEANEGTSQNTILTPEGHTWAHEYSEIYTNTGSTVQSFGAGSWVQITGAFQNKSLDSGEFDWNSNELIVNEVGTYLVLYKASLFNHGTATKARMRTYFNDVANPPSETLQTLAASGTVTGIAGYGIGYIGTVGHTIDLRMKLDDANDVGIEAVQLIAQKNVGGA